MYFHKPERRRTYTKMIVAVFVVSDNDDDDDDVYLDKLQTRGVKKSILYM
jgi:hypothetical protein